jgi:hypothetical protein
VSGFRDRKIMGSLQVYPKARVRTEVSTKPDSGIGRDSSIAPHDFRDPVCRRSKRLRQRSGAHPEWNEIFLS